MMLLCWSTIILIFIIILVIYSLWWSVNNDLKQVYKYKSLFEIDNSILKYVDTNYWLINTWYMPSNLVLLTGNCIETARTIYIRDDVLYEFQKLVKSFCSEFWKPLFVVSAYRSYSYQEELYKKCEDKIFCAKPWYSEHQLWLALDVISVSDYDIFMSNSEFRKYYNWLNNNAYKYWFINSYKKWIDVDTYPKEPWHWRYVWLSLAEYLAKNNIDFSEYFYSLKKY